jgi:hypothetical protein
MLGCAQSWPPAASAHMLELGQVPRGCARTWSEKDNEQNSVVFLTWMSLNIRSNRTKHVMPTSGKTDPDIQSWAISPASFANGEGNTDWLHRRWLSGRFNELIKCRKWVLSWVRGPSTQLSACKDMAQHTVDSQLTLSRKGRCKTGAFSMQGSLCTQEQSASHTHTHPLHTQHAVSPSNRNENTA